MLMVESAYNALNLMFTWFSLGNYYIFFVSFGIQLFPKWIVAELSSGRFDQRSRRPRICHPEHTYPKHHCAGQFGAARTSHQAVRISWRSGRLLYLRNG